MPELTIDQLASMTSEDLARHNAKATAEAAKAKAEAELARFEINARDAFIRHGGSEADFKAAWPEIKAKHLASKVLTPEQEMKLAADSWA